jgi:uncharacterized protein
MRTDRGMQQRPTTLRACKLKGGRAAPIRRCVGCGERAAKAELIRLVVTGDEIVPDIGQRLAGRGAYLHPSLACLDAALRRKAFPRALRLPTALPAGKVAEYLSEEQ